MAHPKLPERYFRDPIEDTLQLRMRSPACRNLKYALGVLGYRKWIQNDDDNYDTGLAKAVKEFQKDAGHANTDGKVGPGTRSRLVRALEATGFDFEALREVTIKPCKILFLASNPTATGRLALDEEARDIEAKIRAAEHRESVTFKTRWAVRPDDLLQALNEDRPTIVHFSGHGSGAPGIVLHDDAERYKPVKASALRHLFTTLKDDIRIVVLNACYSTEQARAIASVIDCVIGMNDSVGDESARKFAASFYRALGFGRSVKNAFEQGVAAVKLEGLPDDKVPELFLRTGVKAEDVFPVRNPQ